MRTHTCTEMTARGYLTKNVSIVISVCDSVQFFYINKIK